MTNIAKLDVKVHIPRVDVVPSTIYSAPVAVKTTGKSAGKLRKLDKNIPIPIYLFIIAQTRVLFLVKIMNCERKRR